MEEAASRPASSCSPSSVAGQSWLAAEQVDQPADRSASPRENPNKQQSERKPFSTEYKAAFTPFDQYVYNEATDSFVRSPTHLDEPLQVAAGDAPPWYKEVERRNERAHEYRFKSELGHQLPLLGAAGGSPLRSPSTSAQHLCEGAPEQAPLGDGARPARLAPTDYRQRDQLISRMASQRGGAREPHQETGRPGSRRAAAAQSPAARSRSQSNRRAAPNRPPAAPGSPSKPQARPPAPKPQATPARGAPLTSKSGRPAGSGAAPARPGASKPVGLARGRPTEPGPASSPRTGSAASGPDNGRPAAARRAPAASRTMPVGAAAGRRTGAASSGQSGARPAPAAGETSRGQLRPVRAVTGVSATPKAASDTSSSSSIAAGAAAAATTATALAGAASLALIGDQSSRAEPQVESRVEAEQTVELADLAPEPKQVAKQPEGQGLAQELARAEEEAQNESKRGSLAQMLDIQLVERASEWLGSPLDEADQQLVVNGLANGLVSADDRFDSSERNISLWDDQILAPAGASEGAGAEQEAEEPYSLLPAEEGPLPPATIHSELNDGPPLPSSEPAQLMDLLDQSNPSNLLLQFEPPVVESLAQELQLEGAKDEMPQADRMQFQIASDEQRSVDVLDEFKLDQTMASKPLEQTAEVHQEVKATEELVEKKLVGQTLLTDTQELDKWSKLDEGEPPVQQEQLTKSSSSSVSSVSDTDSDIISVSSRDSSEIRPVAAEPEEAAPAKAPVALEETQPVPSKPAESSERPPQEAAAVPELKPSELGFSASTLVSNLLGHLDLSGERDSTGLFEEQPEQWEQPERAEKAEQSNQAEQLNEGAERPASSSGAQPAALDSDQTGEKQEATREPNEGATEMTGASSKADSKTDNHGGEPSDRQPREVENNLEGHSDEEQHRQVESSAEPDLRDLPAAIAELQLSPSLLMPETEVQDEKLGLNEPAKSDDLTREEQQSALINSSAQMWDDIATSQERSDLSVIVAASEAEPAEAGTAEPALSAADSAPGEARRLSLKGEPFSLKRELGGDMANAADRHDAREAPAEEPREGLLE